MQVTDCLRCGTRGEGLERAPLPGAAGEEIIRHSCRGCWQEWLAQQVRLINEYRLRPAEPEHYERLIGEMRQFLRLPSVE